MKLWRITCPLIAITSGCKTTPNESTSLANKNGLPEEVVISCESKTSAKLVRISAIIYQNNPNFFVRVFSDKSNTYRPVYDRSLVRSYSQIAKSSAWYFKVQGHTGNHQASTLVGDIWMLTSDAATKTAHVKINENNSYGHGFVLNEDLVRCVYDPKHLSDLFKQADDNQ